MTQDNKRNSKLPLEIALQIAELLTAQDLLNAGSSWKFFYATFANEKIWETAYTKLLDGYPVDHFIITDAVRNVKRPKFVQFDALEDSTFCQLEDWVQSWKQRCVFAVHILQVQGQMVSAAHQKSQWFKPPRSTPLYDSAFIQNIESEAEAPFPIDFVLFLMNFAHHLTFDIDKDQPRAALASGSTFADESKWRDVIESTQFCNYNDADPENIQEERLEGLSEATIDFLNQTKTVCFSLAASVDDGVGHNFLSLLVSTKSDLQDQLPPLVDKETLRVDLQAMDKGIGKVFGNVTWAEATYQLFPIAESFTDYLIQYIATVITTGRVALYEENGYNDLMTALPRSQGLPVSVILPQGKGWDVANYLPIYYSWEKESPFPSINACTSNQPEITDPTWVVTKAFDNPDNVQFPDPPIDIMSGSYKRHWKPYWQHLMSRNGMDMPTSLVHLEKRDMPESHGINSDIYQVQQRRINDWIQSTPCKC